MNYVELSSKNLKDMSIKEANKIKSENNINLIVFVARAGLPVALYMNEVFDVKILGVGAQRKGNGIKEIIGPFIAYLPKFVKNALRTLEVKSNIHEKEPERNIEFLSSLEDIDKEIVKTILIVDDAVDTGNSLKLVCEKVGQEFNEAKIITYALNVWDESKKTISVDYHSFDNTVLRTPMSKDSKEYKSFCAMYKQHSEDNFKKL